MRILIVCQYYYPEQFQINEIAPELVKRGHEVTVLTGLPNYPQGKIYDGYSVGEEQINGVHVIRVKERPRMRGSVNLLRNYLSFMNQANKMANKLNGDFDVVFSYQLSPVLMLKPAIVYAKKNAKPLICYCLDIWPESAKAHTSIKFLYSIVAHYSRKLYQSCDHIAVTSRPFIDYLSDVNGISRNKMSYIPQHADSSFLSRDMVSNDNGIIDFMYAGNMGKGQTLDVIVRAAAEIKDEPFIVHMVGDGTMKDELQELTKALGVQNKFVFYGNQRRESMENFYKMADALLITLRGNNAVGNTMPGKLQTYMTIGKPIFGAINGAASEVIHEADCGKCVGAGDYKGLSILMKNYIDHKEDYVECGKNAAVYFSEHFTLEKFCNSLENLLRMYA